MQASVRGINMMMTDEQVKGCDRSAPWAADEPRSRRRRPMFFSRTLLSLLLVAGTSVATQHDAALARMNGYASAAATSVLAMQPVDVSARIRIEGLKEDIKLIMIPPGKGRIGMHARDAMPGGIGSDLSRLAETPQCEVTFADRLWMGATEITIGQWEAVTGQEAPNRKIPGLERQANEAEATYVQMPVVGVSWEQAQRFTEELSRQCGFEVRLPSEAEWEYACRAGSPNLWSQEQRSAAHFRTAILADGGAMADDRPRGPRPVGQRPANAWGLHDMIGNVEEWCLDRWHPSLEGLPTDGSPRLDPPLAEASGAVDAVGERVVRGGSWNTERNQARPTMRKGVNGATQSAWPWPGDGHRNIGFRVIVNTARIPADLAEHAGAATGRARVIGTTNSVATHVRSELGKAAARDLWNHPQAKALFDAAAQLAERGDEARAAGNDRAAMVAYDAFAPALADAIAFAEAARGVELHVQTVERRISEAKAALNRSATLAARADALHTELERTERLFTATRDLEQFSTLQASLQTIEDSARELIALAPAADRAITAQAAWQTERASAPQVWWTGVRAEAPAIDTKADDAARRLAEGDYARAAEHYREAADNLREIAVRHQQALRSAEAARERVKTHSPVAARSGETWMRGNGAISAAVDQALARQQQAESQFASGQFTEAERSWLDAAESWSEAERLQAVEEAAALARARELEQARLAVVADRDRVQQAMRELDRATEQHPLLRRERAAADAAFADAERALAALELDSARSHLMVAEREARRVVDLAPAVEVTSASLRELEAARAAAPAVWSTALRDEVRTVESAILAGERLLAAGEYAAASEVMAQAAANLESLRARHQESRNHAVAAQRAAESKLETARATAAANATLPNAEMSSNLDRAERAAAAAEQAIADADFEAAARSWTEVLRFAEAAVAARERAIAGLLDNALDIQRPSAERFASVIAAAEHLPGDPRLAAALEQVAMTVPAPERTFALEIAPGVSMRVRWVLPGRCMIGSPPDEPGRRPTGEEARHEKTLTQGCWMAETEVTQGQWRALMATSPSAFPNAATGAGLRNAATAGSGNPADALPVENVSWNDANSFAIRLSGLATLQRLGLIARLPTELEWERACRAGAPGPFGFEDLAELPTRANYDARHPYPGPGGATGVTRRQTVAAGSFLPNAWGLHDLHGNVAEWCLDPVNTRLDAADIIVRDEGLPAVGGRDSSGSSGGGGGAGGRGASASADVKDPTSIPLTSLRPVRGGSWNDRAHRLRAASRRVAPADLRVSTIGFRVVLVPAGAAGPVDVVR